MMMMIMVLKVNFIDERDDGLEKCKLIDRKVRQFKIVLNFNCYWETDEARWFNVYTLCDKPKIWTRPRKMDQASGDREANG